MPAPGSISVGTIGGPETFAGVITERLQTAYPEFAAPVYFPTGPTLFAALGEGRVDAIIGAGATAGDGFTIMADLVVKHAGRWFVVAEELLPFKCALLGRPGSTLGAVRTYYGGHASIAQAAAFAAQHLPGAVGEVSNDPVATARAVASSDGGLALLGTVAMAQRFGLEVLAREVDGGSVNGVWWAVSSRPHLDPAPSTIYVLVRFSADGEAGRLACALADHGFLLAAAHTKPTRAGLLQFDGLLRFQGTGTLEAVRAAVAPFTSVKLVGSLRPRMREA